MLLREEVKVKETITKRKDVNNNKSSTLYLSLKHLETALILFNLKES
jgi:nitroreductase